MDEELKYATASFILDLILIEMEEQQKQTE